ncbi:prokaryotic phospholipase A2-domain-containing protein [Sordaria brevicollis]|uniref:Prokaryotic phospholipase A2-domain-containing protein n=1 Tax=Sordaria brevicollis TaxID=83679 RepID=A0AAE0UAC3_SORBR|nr:prokaryotic phospholipase A2-domain-containing protein [Sordaria brevicollis]
MKFSTLIAFLPAVSALPSAPEARSDVIEARATKKETTDKYLFSITLAKFTSYRKAKNPSTLIWTSDGCSKSPDNPAGYPFTPACHRHDFGYRNYKDQSRFSDANKKKIDDNFKEDLVFQCTNNGHGTACKALAQVYYLAVRAFGRVAGDSPAAAEYEAALAAYNAIVAEAIEKGEDPYYY